ncbi:MAG: golgi-body localization protein domain-containing protein [Benjaminiella poitrasii]|nr:MAG: golgi-body localization protein domain-containing protein [Benjaminiella poitrasii]
MTFSFYHYAFILLIFWIVRICIRSVLALRFHFRFERIGFFSIFNIQYHHHKSSENPLFSIKVGKLKLRLRNRLTLSSPTPYITIYVGDLHFQLHSLSVLNTTKKQRTTSQLNKQLSRVSSSLNKIPWWYSISIVKHIIKFTSALPAQLLMAGLANYVDVQIDNFVLDVEETSFSIEHINFSSVLFANMTPHSSNEQLKENISSIQHHSLKRAQHLFKEKFFEIMVSLGPISIIDKQRSSDKSFDITEMLTLPSGGSVTISCHLSAGCVTLKDIDITARIDSFNLKLSPLFDLIQKMKRRMQTDNDDSDAHAETDSENVANGNRSFLIQVFRSVSLSITSTNLEIQHQSACFSVLNLQRIHISGNAINSVDSYYTFHYSSQIASWEMSENPLITTDDQTKILNLPKITLKADVSHWLFTSKNINIPAATAVEFDTFAVNPTKVGVTSRSDSLGPNKKYVKLSLTIHKPELCFDLSKMNLLNKITNPTKKKHLSQDVQYKNGKNTIYNLPRCSLSICVEKPAVIFKCGPADSRGTISGSSIQFDLDGKYEAQKNRPTSVLPRHSEPTPTTTQNISNDDHIEFQPNSSAIKRLQSYSRPSWTNLFRRSWRSKSGHNSTDNKSVEWNYRILATMATESTCLGVSSKNKKHTEDSIDDATRFISIEKFEFKVHTSLNVGFTEDQSKQIMFVNWDPDAHHINTNLSIKRPIVDVCATTPETEQLQIEFWTDTIIEKIQKQFTNKHKNINSTAETKANIHSYLYGYMSIFKFTVVMSEFSLVLGGLDRGIKGKRQIPEGYLDNAPTKDTHVRVITSIKQSTYTFNGSRVFSAICDKWKYKSNTIFMDHCNEREKLLSEQTNINQHTLLGSIRLVIEHLTVERIFKSQNSTFDECSWRQHKERKSVVMWVSRVIIRAETTFETAYQRIILEPSIVIKKIGTNYSIANHYACLITISSTLKVVKRLLIKKNKSQTNSSVSNASKPMIRGLQFQIIRFDCHIALPGTTKLYLRMDSLHTERLNISNNTTEAVPPIAVRNLTLYGEAPGQEDRWDQLFEMDNIYFSIEKEVNHSTSVNQISLDKLYLRVPHNYELCNFIDSAVTLVKAIKAVHSRISNNAPFLYFGPHEKKTPTVLPQMRLTCKLLTFQFEDDPFEVRLRSIWKTGLTEQANRIAIQDAFELKAQTLLQRPNNKNQPEREYVYLNEETDARVNEAWQGLQEHNSNSWKRHIDAAILKEAEFYNRIHSGDYRHSIIVGQLDEVFDNIEDKEIQNLVKTFCIDIVDLPRYPPLLDLTIKHTSLHFSPPVFDLRSTRQFMYDVGKGQPLDTPLSTLIPFHLNWKSGETWAQIRDYPVPFILVPPAIDNTESITISQMPSSSYAWTLSGDYVFGDDLGDLDATRRIHVPVVNENETEYSMDVARTSTPLKFFSIVNIDVHNSALSHICWSVPYQPAIQDITRVLDTFTKPPVDPSQKVGFWDKIRLLIHTRTKISFIAGGDLAMVMKGTRDPYDMSEKGFGLAKVWRNDVIWLIGHENSEGEFMQIISRDYAFGVPDLLHGGYTAPYILAANQTEKNETKETHIRHSVSLSSFNSSTLNKNSKSKARFVKIALKLSGGIRMGLGCHLERMCYPNCEICDENSNIMPEARTVHKSRLLNFLPHYKVKYKAPQNVHQKNYDAYRGFRSDFIHFSLSIIKLSSYDEARDRGDITGNSMHLTPGFIDHFVSWFRLFGGAMSYPLRNGSLFPKADNRPTQKFGRHMSTMKYKVDVNPLIVGYFIKDENVVAEDITTEELGDSVGLKGFVKGFSIDIHQRREIVNVADYKLDQKRLKANWPVAEAEIQLKNIDLRAVKASYTMTNGELNALSGAENISVPVQTEDDYLSSESDNGLNMMEGLNYQCNNDSDSADWVDLDDFVEMGVATPDILPAIQVLPFAFSPCIYYLRQTNREDIDRYKYLHKTHDCILGTAVGTREMQMLLLQDRSKSIDVQIRKHQTRLHNIETKRLQINEDKEETRLKELSAIIVEKTRILYEKRHLIQEYLKELNAQTMPGSVHERKTDMYSTSTIFGKDSLSQWEDLMGHFKVRYIAHNPQILWNNSVRNIVYHGLDLRDHRRAISYYMTSRTIKFLRDLIDTFDLQYGHGHKQFVLDDNESGMDVSMAEELINQLLSEQKTKFYAPNETEEEKSVEGNEYDEVDISLSENVNNPLMQLKTIPSSYVMKSSYLIDLLNPQISLQSDCDMDNIVLVANERTQVKGFNIIDESDPDVEMEMVKHRTIVSLDNLQFFVAKKEQFDSVDLLLDNHYGAKESDHWLAWIPPEMLINYVKSSDKFQRIGERIAATLQYDKYNPLRIKTNSNLYTRAHPFEDRCDSVQLNFPKLRLTADSAQYNAIYQVATDLLLYKEPAKKERLARLREIMMAADRSSMFEATEKIASLQKKARQLIFARDQYRQNMTILDDRRLEEFKSIRLDLYDTLEELYLGMEAIKLMQSNQRKDYHEPKTNLKFLFCARNLEWEMLTKNEKPLCECTLFNFTFDFVSKEDHSSINTLEVDVMQVKNLSPSPVFVDVLAPYFDSRKPYDFSRHKMLRCYFVSLAPVGGIPVIQHLEINLHPVRVQMTYNFGRELVYYLFPPEKQQKQADTIAITYSSSTPTAAIASESDTTSDRMHSNPSLSSSQPNNGEKAEIITLKCSSGAGIQNHNVSAPSSFQSNTLSGDSYQANGSSVFNNAALSTREGIDQELLDDPPSSSNSPTASQTLKKNKKQLPYKLVKNRVTDDLSVMKKRASSNRTFILVKIPGARHCLSYQGPKEKNIEDLRDFAFEQPTLEFRNETWSWFELMTNIKKDFMRAALLHNSPALLKEKLLRRHPRENSKLIESSITVHSTPTYVPDFSSGTTKYQPKMMAIVYDIDNNSSSSKDDPEDMPDIKDTISLHSAQSDDTTEVNSSEANTKRSNIWSKLKKTKKTTESQKNESLVLDETVVKNRQNASSHDNASSSSSEKNSRHITSGSLSVATQHLRDEAQLAIKGKYLLGKYYNGPTQWLNHGGKKFKMKQASKKS